MYVKPIKLDSWVKELIVDPLSKEPLIMDEEHNCLISPYGRRYPINGELFDLRLLNNETTTDQKVWKAGQREYERWSANLSEQDLMQDYCSDIEGVRQVYQNIAVEGRCLDVGGHQGRLRKFLSPEQEYITCDPFLNVFDDLEKQSNLLEVYPCLLNPVNFVCCDAEFLPFRSASFQAVHMRSVIDHFLSPELALNEAYRVLTTNGALIVGLFVRGGKRGQRSVKFLAKKFVKEILTGVGVKRFKDYHVWHPTYNEVTELICDCGFKTEKVHWQKGYDDTVCYILARKYEGLTRRPRGDFERTGLRSG